MGKPLEHSQNNVKKYGGKVDDYLPIHEMMDISKSGLGDKRHRAIFHNATAAYIIIPKIFGSVLTNSDGKQIATSQIAEDHILEDFGGKFIPTLQDWLGEIPLKSWMSNGGKEEDYPPSTSGAFKWQSMDDVRPWTKSIDVEDIAIDGASRYRDRPKIEISEERKEALAKGFKEWADKQSKDKDGFIRLDCSEPLTRDNVFVTSVASD